MGKYRAKILEGVVVSDKYPKRIFLARPESAIRKYNQAEVITVLKKHGFEILYMHEYDALEQRNIIHNAKIIVGSLGAAFANLIFTHEGTYGLIFKPSAIGFDADMTNVAGISGCNLYYLDYKVDTSSFNAFHFSNKVSQIDTISLENTVQKLIRKAYPHA